LELDQDKNLFDFIHTCQSRRHVEKSLPACHHVKKLFQTVVVGGLLITILMAFFSMMANFSFFLFQSAVLLLFLVF